MSAHLSHEELTDSLLGISSLTVNAHLLDCAVCGNELDHLRNSIAAFRGAAHAWTENAVAGADGGRPLIRSLPKRSRPAAGWVLAAAVMILLVAVSAFYWRDQKMPSQAHSTRVPNVATVAADTQSQIDQDNQLLSQVDSEISEAVPAPMQPLLVSEPVVASRRNQVNP
jgi:hypothetical protein